PPAPPDLHSFPTRRSSDLTLRQALESSRVRAVRKIPPARQERLFRPGAEASAVSRDGRLLVMGRGNTARLVSRRTGRVLRIFKGDRKSTRLNSSHVSISYA